MELTKYSDAVAGWLKQLGYTHCFYVSGGNIMHLLESCSRAFKCVSVIHEVAAGIATEYFNEISEREKAFALVTAGPGITNIVSAMAGAFLESRELLVIGGQVKTEDLARGALRQRGIQEVDGVSIARPVCVTSRLLDSVVDAREFFQLVRSGSSSRKGPVFIELPLDIQGRNIDEKSLSSTSSVAEGVRRLPVASDRDVEKLAQELRKAERPMFLLGGGVDRSTAHDIFGGNRNSGLAVTTTWNGTDRVAADHPNYFGRPNTWGQRYSNLLLQQADLLVGFGTRLGLQQTGFNWRQFVPGGKVVQVDIDQAELRKGHPRVDWPICADANDLLKRLVARDLGSHDEWLAYCSKVKNRVPLIEPNTTRPEYLSPYRLVTLLSGLCADDDVVIPCSSGGAFTVMMQAFHQRRGQVVVTNKGLASMGYGLGGAIGASVAFPSCRVVLVEGDGGFAQNVQELGTVAVNNLNLKMFVFDDGGYASIRMTQKNYFGGRYVGCDRSTGLGLPDWEALFQAYRIPVMRLRPGFEADEQFRESFSGRGPAGFVVSVDPEQTYFPKITSRVTASGSMESNPLHLMSPPLDDELLAEVGTYLPGIRSPIAG